MRTIKDDAPTQLETRAVAFAIVLPGAPVGEVLPRLDVEPEHAPNLPRIDQLFQYLQAGMEAHVVADLDVAIAVSRLGNQRLDSTGFVGKRFLNTNVGVSLQRGQRLLDVVHRRRTDEHDLRAEFPQRLAIVAEDFPA